jgi:hypothetical protein
MAPLLTRDTRWHTHAGSCGSLREVAPVRQELSAFGGGSWEPGRRAARRLPPPGRVVDEEGASGSRGDDESGGSGGSVGADVDASGTSLEASAGSGEPSLPALASSGSLPQAARPDIRTSAATALAALTIRWT